MGDIFYLWDTSFVLYDIYKILIPYHNENYGINAAILLSLIDSFKLDSVKTLRNVPYIHAGYVNILIEERKAEDDRQNSTSTD